MLLVDHSKKERQNHPPEEPAIIRSTDIDNGDGIIDDILAWP